MDSLWSKRKKIKKSSKQACKIHISLKTDMAGAKKLSALAEHCAQVKTLSIPGPGLCCSRCLSSCGILCKFGLEQVQTTAIQSSPWLSPLYSPAEPPAACCEISCDNREYRAIPCNFACRFLCPETFLVQQTSCLVSLPPR